MVSKKKKEDGRFRVSLRAQEKPHKQRVSKKENNKNVPIPVPIKQGFVKYMDYRPAKLYPLKQTKATLKKEWFVKWSIYDHEKGEWVYDRRRLNINRVHDLEEKKIFGAGAVKKINELLDARINPREYFDAKQKEVFDPLADPAEAIRQMPISEGWKWAKEKHEPEVSVNTRKVYKNVFDKLIPGISKVGYSALTVGQFKKSHLRVLMDYLQDKHKLSNGRYNTYVEVLKAIYKEFRRYDVFDVSPLVMFERKKEAKAKRHEPLTDKEKEAVYNHFIKVNPAFVNYILIAYHTGMRPKEISSLQIHNFIEDEKAFKIDEDETVEIRGQTERKTKTKVTRYIALTDEAMEVLKAMKLDSYPKDYFIFSRGFIPGPTFFHNTNATELWFSHVITKLKIDKKLYWLKGTGATDKLKAGVSMEAVSKQMGHTSKTTTEIYTNENTKILAEGVRKKSKRFIEG